MFFEDRKEAGKLLTPLLASYKGKKDVIVLGLARGGVVVAYEIALGLHVPLNVVVPRKIGAPSNPEFAIGALMEDGESVFNLQTIQMLNIPKSYIDRVVEHEKEVARQRIALYRKNNPLPDLKGLTVIIVDDGIATGATMQDAIKSIRKSGAKKIVMAVPVAAADSFATIQEKVDDAICLHVDEDLGAIGYFYRIFGQTEDDEVIKLLEEARHAIQTA